MPEGSSSLRVLRTVAELRSTADQLRAAGRRLGFVPTMGALHRGHQALIRTATARSDAVLVSIFVNPTQFGPNEDLARYPRTLEADLEMCRQEGVALVFAPETEQMYPSGERTRVNVSGVTDELCGRHRPGHFEGVATVVTKLFCAVGPCLAVFGKKDYQQLQVIRRLVGDLLLPVEIVGAPTIRECDGLALSSRNRYLSAEQRVAAVAIPSALSAVYRAHRQGERSAQRLLDSARQRLLGAGLELQYLSLADPDTLSIHSPTQEVPERTLLALAAWSGSTRLIDNVVLGEDGDPLEGPFR